MRIGISYKGQYNSDIDFTNPYSGNPGVGGTIYLEILLAQMLCEDDDYTPVVFSPFELKLDNRINQVICADEYSAIAAAKESNIDIMLYVAGHKNRVFYEQIEKNKVPCVAWVHNYIDEETLLMMEKCDFIKRVVFVGNELYDYYIDDGIISKSTFIYNMVPPINIASFNDAPKNVTYLGALVPEKGFHLLAEIWKDILAREPNANLYVIGSGKLYNNKSKLGKCEIAEEGYEKRILSFLRDDEGNILQSVHFLGSLGREKYEFLKQTAVGVANPSGHTETFCMSAVEMEQLGIPVISYRGHGILDTVKNKKTGFLVRGKYELKKRILLLLQDKRLRQTMGNAAIEFSSQFDCNTIINEWKSLFRDVKDGVSPSMCFSYKNFSNDLKWLKWLNYCIIKILHIHGLSVARLMLRLKRFVRKLSNR